MDAITIKMDSKNSASKFNAKDFISPECRMEGGEDVQFWWEVCIYIWEDGILSMAVPRSREYEMRLHNRFGTIQVKFEDRLADLRLGQLTHSLWPTRVRFRSCFTTLEYTPTRCTALLLLLVSRDQG